MELEEILRRAAGSYRKLWRQAKDRVESDRTAVRLVRETLKDMRMSNRRTVKSDEPEEETGTEGDCEGARTEAETGKQEEAIKLSGTEAAKAAEPGRPFPLGRDSGDP